MIGNEYLRFMQTLTEANTPEGVRKMANLVLEYLDAIQPLGTHQGQRVKRIVRLAQAHWQTLATDITIENSGDTIHNSFRQTLAKTNCIADINIEE